MAKLLKRETTEDFFFENKNDQEFVEQITNTELWEYDSKELYLKHKTKLECNGWKEDEEHKLQFLRCYVNYNENEIWRAQYTKTRKATVSKETMEYLTN